MTLAELYAAEVRQRDQAARRIDTQAAGLLRIAAQIFNDAQYLPTGLEGRVIDWAYLNDKGSESPDPTDRIALGLWGALDGAVNANMSKVDGIGRAIHALLDALGIPIPLVSDDPWDTYGGHAREVTALRTWRNPAHGPQDRTRAAKRVFSKAIRTIKTRSTQPERPTP